MVAQIATNPDRGTASFILILLNSIIMGIVEPAPEIPPILERPINKNMTTAPTISRVITFGFVNGRRP